LQEKHAIEAELLFAKAGQLLANFKGDAKRKATMEQATLGQLAQLAMKRKDWKTAHEKLEALLKLSPDNATTLEMLARTLFEQKKPDEAMEKLKAAVAVNKDTLTPDARMALWWEGAGDRKKAGEAMVEALNAKPQDFKTRLTAADWALQSKSFDQARQQADIAIKLDPNSVKAKVLAGNIALFQKDYPAAAKYYQEVLTLEPQNFTASNNLALALCDQGDDKNIQLAGQYATMNAKLYPNQPEPYSTLGWVFFKMNKVREAEQALRRAASAGRSLRPDTAYYFACVYAATDRNAEAKKLLGSALKTKGLFSEREAAQALLDKLK
ncbi:MAG: tetratricopeptide repeat protein, partial [Planctomycetota bacterium]|nr:tetratricopeptide repeat protein [Planctomycetota bacterium]